MIRVIYYSATGNTLQQLQQLVGMMQERWPQPATWHSYTTPADRQQWHTVEKGDVVVWGSPVYAGKLPNKLLHFVKEHLQGHGNPTILLTTFGNRSFDHALAEMVGIATANGLRPVAAVAMVAPHAFSHKIGKGRPSEADNEELRKFVNEIDLERTQPLPVTGEASAPYYQPLGEEMTPAQFLRAMPTIDHSRCNGCGKCASLCTMGSIQHNGDSMTVDGICTKCMACVKGCPQQAIAIYHPDFSSHIRMLEQHCRQPQPNSFFV